MYIQQSQTDDRQKASDEVDLFQNLACSHSLRSWMCFGEVGKG